MKRKGLIGKKLGMTHIFEDGKRIPVTVVRLGPCPIVQVKTPEGKDGYGAIQVGFEDKDHRKVTKPMAGHYKRADLKPQWILREFRMEDAKDMADYKVGESLTLEMFEVGAWIDATGTSKGKGFAGVMKRHNMKGSKQKTHGTHEVFRHPGSIGCRSTPGRVMRGKRLPGHMGAETVTVQNLKIAKLDTENGIALIRGAVPGPINGYVMIREAAKKTARAAA